MKFGVRECTNIVFRAKTNTTIGKSEFKAGQPVLYIDSAKTSTLEGAATTVYAQGGRGNARLISWEGEKTLTFTVEDALLSPLGFSILSGAGLIETGSDTDVPVHAHRVVQAVIEGSAQSEYYIKGNSAYVPIGGYGSSLPHIYNDNDMRALITALTVPAAEVTDNSHTLLLAYLEKANDIVSGGQAEAVDFILQSAQFTTTVPDVSEISPMIIKTVSQTVSPYIDLAGALYSGETICKDAPIFVIRTEQDGSLTSEFIKARLGNSEDKDKIYVELNDNLDVGSGVVVDFYVIAGSPVKELQVDAENFAGYYYVEADTLFRRQDTGKDMPAIITLPNVKIQSNFTFTMASSGDPSTFTFTMDAMPGYTYFNKTKKVLCVLQVIDTSASEIGWESVMKHTNNHVSKHDEGNGVFEDSWI